MGAFSDGLAEVSKDSRFSTLELEKMFKTEEQLQALADVTKILKEETRTNAARRRLLELGDRGLDAIVKIAKKALV